MKVFSDGDLYTYRVAASCQSKVTREIAEFDGSNEGDILVLPIEVAYQRITELLYSTRAELGITAENATDHVIFLRSITGNFRDAVYADYKAGRPPKPEHIVALEEYLIQEFGAVRAEYEEADDMLGKAQQACWDNDEQSVLDSFDKDLGQIPGTHFDFRTAALSEVTEEEGLFFFYQQLITGDMTDNIHGCPGIGPKKAQKALAGCATPEEMYGAAVECYQKCFPDRSEEEIEQLIEMTGRLVYIRRYPNELWETP